VNTGPDSGGLGAETTISPACANTKLIVLAGRNEEKVFSDIEQIHEINPRIQTRFDLSDQASICSVAVKTNSTVESLDILVNNAGSRV
jgi:NADP-dependent 3-hydroxy acid dehydrogenase YdfG